MMFTKTRENPADKRSPSHWVALAHRGIQLVFFLVVLWIGACFIAYAAWLLGWREAFSPRPPAVEGFLPISALLALKRLLLTGQWDDVHPAGLAILVTALVTALILRKGFCGYVCPVGTVSFWLFRLGRRLGLTVTPPRWLTWLLSIPKYLLLAFFLCLVLPGGMSVTDIDAFLHSPYNMVADTKMLLFFMPPSSTTSVIIALLVMGSIFIPSFWCRFLCPYGALLGLFSLFSPLAMRRSPAACTGCRRCARACPQGIAVHQLRRVSSAECNGCQECLAACPEKDCLSMRLGYTAQRTCRVPWPLVGISMLAAFVLAWALAEVTGHWVSEVPTEMLQMLHQRIDSIVH